MFFSSRRQDVLRRVEAEVDQVVRRLPFPKSLRVNGAKTTHLSKRTRRVVTGLILASDGKVSVGRARKRQIQSQIHRLSDLDSDERLHLAGTLAFVKSVEPGFINRIIVKYGSENVDEAMRPRSPPAPPP